MPRTPLTLTSMNRAGIALVCQETDQTNGNAFQNDGTFLVIVSNETASAQTVTFRVSQKVDGDLAVADRVIQVPAGKSLLLGKFPTGTYNQPDGSVAVDCSAPMGLLVINVP